ncbi:L-lactate permease [Haloarchaeobius sp. HME9146]|uniref:L-lactate permease n=1 Tax=Haloarchaeobius sp. HME9146 TaxID=2978732 RepID=UPI0021C1D322|nr:L-lactate permease [Haloarchaeobius sp. HME9146]MCT9094827.1 L-lactate permease [Haloarchaeobius sp. HME9146]
MADPLMILLAVLPLVAITVLMVGLYQPATTTMPIAWVTAAAVGLIGWGMSPDLIAAATIAGVFTATEILWIVFGAILLLFTLKESGAFDAINAGFSSISDDRRVQVVLLVFLMGSFIEGAAGFGTPAAIVGPLLVGLGFPPLAAVVVALTGNIMAITFGAVGTPLIIGLEDVFSKNTAIQEAINTEGMTVTQYVADAAVWAASIHAIVGIVLPFIGVAMMTRFFGEERSIKPALQVLPLTIFAWASFAIPYWLTAYFLGPTFPALLGAMVGLFITAGTLKAGFLLPDEEWDFAPREQWPSHWVGDIEPGESVSGGDQTVAADGGVVQESRDMSLGMAWAPYIMTAALLVVTRVWTPLQSFLNENLVIAWSNILGTGLDGSFRTLYLPGAIFVFVSVITYLLHGMDGQEVKNSWQETTQKILPAVIALWFAVATVQIMINSGQAAGTDSMLVILSDFTANLAGGVYPFFSALVGAFGAFIAGSNTVSDILFGTFQFNAAQNIGVPTQILVGAQAVGGAIGNLVAIHNVVAALAVVGLVGEEGRVIRLELIPLLYYAAMTGVLTILFAYVVAPGAF